MKLFAKGRRKLTALIAVTILGAIVFGVGLQLSQWQSPQIAAYNRGTELYEQALQSGDAKAAEEAVKAFDQSYDAYRRASQNPGWFERNLLPPPSAEYAALAQSHKGVIMLLLQKPEQAVLAFKESLSVNPGDNYEGALSPYAVDYTRLPTADVDRLKEQAYQVKYNLELLFKKNPSQQQKEGKGEGKPGDKPGDKPVPSNDPGKLPGKGNRDQI